MNQMSVARKLGLALLLAVAIFIGLALVLDVAYFVHGSLEAHPTEEQQEEVRIVTGTLAVVLSVVEWALLAWARSIWLGGRRSSSHGDTPHV